MIRVDCAFGYELPIGKLTTDFRDSSFTAVTGPNGSGKSTLLSTIAGELSPVSGSVTINGVPTLQLAGARQILKLSAPEFYPDLSVGEHLQLLRTPQATIDQWALADLLTFPPQWLSSGQQQRVFLASQLATRAEAILLDEPERHLDDEWTPFLVEKLREISSDSIVIVATHSPTLINAADENISL
ncbi:ABC transporter ATP-binding protein [Corynebacterium sp. S7]